MGMKLYNSELKVMEVLWADGDTTAKRLAEILKERTNWSKTTTYTVVSKCVEKGAIQRLGNNFLCHPLVTKKETQEYEVQELLNKMYDGAADKLIASVLGMKTLSSEEIDGLKKLVQDLK